MVGPFLDQSFLCSSKQCFHAVVFLRIADRIDENKHASHGGQNRFGEVFDPDLAWK